nr:MAG TPA: hypothetical protein [Microviridae sp.]
MFSRCGTLVFDENGCSASAERLFLMKMVVQQVRNACYGEK